VAGTTLPVGWMHPRLRVWWLAERERVCTVAVGSGMAGPGCFLETFNQSNRTCVVTGPRLSVPMGSRFPGRTAGRLRPVRRGRAAVHRP
jgi:hypothetical protein